MDFSALVVKESCGNAAVHPLFGTRIFGFGKRGREERTGVIEFGFGRAESADALGIDLDRKSVV